SSARSPSGRRTRTTRTSPRSPGWRRRRAAAPRASAVRAALRRRDRPTGAWALSSYARAGARSSLGLGGGGSTLQTPSMPRPALAMSLWAAWLAGCCSCPAPRIETRPCPTSAEAAAPPTMIYTAPSAHDFSQNPALRERVLSDLYYYYRFVNVEF